MALLLVFTGIAVLTSRKSILQSTSSVSKSTPLAAISVPKNTSDATLDNIIRTWASQQSFTSTVVAKELTGQLRSSSYNSTSSVVTASTFKLYVAYAVLHGVEQGTYTLKTTLNDGYSIQTDLTNMIVNSDNNAARSLGFMVGWQNIDKLLQSIGINSTALNNYNPPSTTPVGDKHTTAADLAKTLQYLYAGELLNQTNTQFLLGLMEEQTYRVLVPAGVPSNIIVADKPGWLDPGDGDGDETIENDAAIVYGPKSTYILVITTDGGVTKPLADLSKLVYNHLET